MAGADRFAFSRFGEKRNYKSSDVAGYDEYVEGVEAEETTSLDTPLQEDNRGFKLIQKMGWRSGTGLGKYEQGRVDPVPFELKDDYLGLGRWTMELELAQDATEKRRQMEIEKDVTPDLVERYKAQAEKDHKMAETIAEMRKSFYCELCDKQYTKYSEFDNHLNSYDHHHRQRLKDLKQYESGRKFGGHRNLQEERDKTIAAQIVALERAQMTAKRNSQRGFAPAFKPIGDGSTNWVAAVPQQGATPTTASGVKRSKESEDSSAKIAEKKAKIAKFGLKFQSAGTLVTVGDKSKMTSFKTSAASYQAPDVDSYNSHPPPGLEMLSRSAVGSIGSFSQYSGGASSCDKKQGHEEKLEFSDTSRNFEQSVKDGSSDQRFSFGFQRKQQNSVPSKAPGKHPPPLMSRQRELTMSGVFGGDSDEEEDAGLAQLPIRKPLRFKFNIGK